MSPAVALVLHVAAFLVLGAGASWAIRSRRRSQAADRILRAHRRTRLQQHMHLRRRPDTQPAPIDETCLHLEALYHAPAYTGRRTP